MSDSDEPPKPRRPVMKPSVWSTRPIPRAAPERRTADAPTPKLKELAARRAVVADATRVAPPEPPQPPHESPTRLANDPFAHTKHLEQLEAARQAGSVADKVRRKAEAVESLRGLAASGVRHTAIFTIQGMEDQKAHDRATLERYAGAPGAR